MIQLINAPACITYPNVRRKKIKSIIPEHKNDSRKDTGNLPKN